MLGDATIRRANDDGLAASRWSGPPAGTGQVEGGGLIVQFTEPDALAKASAENFPVASRLLPSRYRRHLLALYGFARLVDDTGDEATGHRPSLLDELDAELTRALLGSASHPVFVRLQTTIAACRLPEQPLRNLIEANRRDQRINRYATFDDLLDYCSLSANPVGRLVLGVFGQGSPQQLQWSDAICSALQVIEHCQDVAEDVARDRIYLPQEDLARFGVDEADLRQTSASPAVRDLVAFEVDRARGLLGRGAPLVGDLRGSARLAVAGFIAGGRGAADAMAAGHFDVLAHCRRPRRSVVLAHALRVFATGGRR